MEGSLSLPYSAFDKDQRVTHAAITENKNLSAVLEFIKEEQDKAPPKKPRAGK
ncbi:transposase (plasmid) [Antarctobacter heliothermus]|uniref:Transposase n=1 Tax=Antarctobacter heliothermus TaxID=74033 RepID=A0A222ECD4_9RHOB|nr:transposase [Antarctobacter heliothermus]